MCYACNPHCSICSPARVTSAPCPACGEPMSFTREEYLLAFGLPHRKTILERKMLERGLVPDTQCKKCGADMADALRASMPPKECKRSRIVCGYPCGRSAEKHEQGAAPCPFMVPLGRADDANSNDDCAAGN